jgi:hypothetical protein
MKLAFLLILLLVQYAQAVSLEWDANPTLESVTSYNVYQVQNGNPTLVTTVVASGANVDAYLTRNQKTTFYVKAVNAGGESPASATVVVQCACFGVSP